MSDMEPPTEPTNRRTLTASCVCVCAATEMPAQKHLPATKSTSKHPPRSDSKGGRVPFLPPPLPCSRQGRFTAPRGPHHTARRVQLAVRDAAEILAAAPVVPRAVTDGAKGVEKDLQAVEGGRGHQLFPARERRRRCVTASTRRCGRTHDRGCCVGFSRAQVFLRLTANWMAAKLLEGCRSY